MLTKGKTREALERFRGIVINQSRAMLTRKDKNASKKLFDSIDGKVRVMPNSIKIEFFMEEYGIFQDKGVSGTEQKYDTPFAYTTKMPPPKAFDKWTVRRGIAPRDAQGRFLSRKTINFLIARSVFRKGIKPSLFFTQPFQNAYKTLPEEITKAYALDVEDLLAHAMNNKRLK